VIPNRLAVISLNTLYFFTSNQQVNGCRTHDDPGMRQLDWLAQHLANYRQRQMAVIVIGHLAASPLYYYPHCLKRYNKLLAEYADIIRIQLFGHQNLDYFLFADDEAVDTILKKPPKRKDYLAWLIDHYQRISILSYKKAPPIALVSPSVFPTFHPSVRIFHYQTLTNASYPFGQPLDYEQYRCDLDALPANWTTDQPLPYQRLYRASEAYQLSALTTAEYAKFAKRIIASAQGKEAKLWYTFFRHLYTGTSSKDLLRRNK
jgi:hypothetical protein